MTNQLPTYTKKEERINSLSHGFGALLSLIAFIFLLLKSDSQKEYITCTIFGLSMFNLYLISCLYHAKSPKKKSKKILRLIDHCNVYLLVFGTYIPISLLSIPSQKAIYLVILVGFITLIGIILSCLNLNRYQTLEVICHLFNGWSILIGFPELHQTLTRTFSINWRRNSLFYWCFLIPNRVPKKIHAFYLSFLLYFGILCSLFLHLSLSSLKEQLLFSIDIE